MWTTKKICDNCWYYKWYFDWCTKWKCYMDWRSVCRFWINKQQTMFIHSLFLI